MWPTTPTCVPCSRFLVSSQLPCPFLVSGSPMREFVCEDENTTSYTAVGGAGVVLAENTRHMSAERTIVAWKLAVSLTRTRCYLRLPPSAEASLKFHYVLAVNTRYWVSKRDDLQQSGKTTRLMVTRSCATGSAKTTAVLTSTTPSVRSPGHPSSACHRPGVISRVALRWHALYDSCNHVLCGATVC